MPRKKKDPFPNDQARLRYYELEGFDIERTRCTECGKSQFAVRPPEMKTSMFECMFCNKKALVPITQ